MCRMIVSEQEEYCTLCIMTKSLTDVHAGCKPDDGTTNVLLFQHLHTATRAVRSHAAAATNGEGISTEKVEIPGSTG